MPEARELCWNDSSHPVVYLLLLFSQGTTAQCTWSPLMPSSVINSVHMGLLVPALGHGLGPIHLLSKLGRHFYTNLVTSMDL